MAMPRMESGGIRALFAGESLGESELELLSRPIERIPQAYLDHWSWQCHSPLQTPGKKTVLKQGLEAHRLAMIKKPTNWHLERTR
jgi:hypothetical protein